MRHPILSGRSPLKLRPGQIAPEPRDALAHRRGSGFVQFAGYIAGARLSARIGLFAATTWSLLIGAAFAVPALPALLGALAQVTWVGWATLAFLAVLCTLVGYAAWFWALDRGGVASIAPLQFGQPVVSLIIAVMFLSESLSAAIVLALCLISCGVYLSRKVV